MRVPGETVVQLNAKILLFLHSRQVLTSQVIGKCDPVCVPGDVKYFAFRWVELHLPLSFPGGKVVQIFLQLAGVINTVDLSGNSSIISEYGQESFLQTPRRLHLRIVPSGYVL